MSIIYYAKSLRLYRLQESNLSLIDVSLRMHPQRLNNTKSQNFKFMPITEKKE